MKEIFHSNDIQEDDKTLVQKSLNGDKDALEKLIKKNQNWVFNIALNMVADADEAADITQDVLIKVITNLKGFRAESSFRTWVYRIVKNHFLNQKRSDAKGATLSFEDFGNGLDSIRDERLEDHSFEAENKLLVEEAKISCMKAMLLCLTSEQRLIYILGELFEIPDAIGGQIMEISKANFRVKLHRARTQLYKFMNDKCGLINKENPCRCAKKTVGFIKKGYVDPKNLQFQKDKIVSIERAAERKTRTFEKDVLREYQALYQDHPFLKSPESLKAIKDLLSSKTVRETFHLK